MMSIAEQFDDVDVFVGLDHSQLEIRVLAQVSQDQLLIQLIQSGEDIHSAVGTELTGIPIAKIKSDRETRTTVKGIHFGIIFGLSKKSLYLKLKVDAAAKREKFTWSEKKVYDIYDHYFERFKGVKAYIDSQAEFAEKNGYVETLFGFRRECTPFVDEDRSSFWMNQAVNSPIQGTAHQLMLISLAVLALRRKTYYLWQRLCMEVHDSLIAYVKLKDLPTAYVQGVQLLEKDVLEHIKKWWPELHWQVPLKAEGKAGFRFGVLVEKYAGEPAEEFVEKWCQQNREFEKKVKADMAKAKL